METKIQNLLLKWINLDRLISELDKAAKEEGGSMSDELDGGYREEVTNWIKRGDVKSHFPVFLFFCKET